MDYQILNKWNCILSSVHGDYLTGNKDTRNTRKN